LPGFPLRDRESALWQVPSGPCGQGVGIGALILHATLRLRGHDALSAELSRWESAPAASAQAMRPVE